MKDQDQIKAIAELDGLAERLANEKQWDTGTIRYTSSIPDYLHSRDAIIPVIEKQILVDRDFDSKFTMHLHFLTRKDDLRSVTMIIVTAAPLQLCEALLRATGKWTE